MSYTDKKNTLFYVPFNKSIALREVTGVQAYPKVTSTQHLICSRQSQLVARGKMALRTVPLIVCLMAILLMTGIVIILHSYHLNSRI